MRLTNPMASLNTTPRRLAAAVLVVIVVGVVAKTTVSIASGNLTATVANSNNSLAASTCFQPYAVAVTNNTFGAAGTQTIKAGCSVKWTVAGGTQHNSKSTAPWVGLWSSSNMSGGQNFTYLFASTGTFPYRCSIHGGAMTGTITVN
jgi:plastocyanin